jgi:HAD superfamily hydrolase (TIGR01458 family)
MMADMGNFKAVLFDLDGVLYIGKQPIAGAIEAVNKIRDAGIACRFVTNTSTLSIASLQKKLQGLGFELAPDEIMSAPQAAIQYLKSQANPVCRLLLADDVKQDFAQFPQSDTEANFIVVGDIGNAWSYQMLNEIFNSLMRGAKLIAIHKNRFWQTETGLQMDIGAFVTGLEYAANTQAMLIGKPSVDFFNAVLSDLKLKPNQALMIGDDIDSDIGGARIAGLKSVLVRTGKFRQAYTEKSTIIPDWIIDDVTQLPALLGKA